MTYDRYDIDIWHMRYMIYETYDIWHRHMIMIHDPWYMIFDVWHMVYDTWRVIYDSSIEDMTHLQEIWLIYRRHDSSMGDMTHPWHMVYDAWRVIYDTLYVIYWILYHRLSELVQVLVPEEIYAIYKRHDSCISYTRDMTHYISYMNLSLCRRWRQKPNEVACYIRDMTHVCHV
jgi:hypothetical protein